MSIDLHIHTTMSDGDVEPVSLVRAAAAAGLKIIALADHETIAGYHPAAEEGIQLGVKVIPAVEFLTVYNGQEIHLLGYFLDPDHKLLRDKLVFLREQRTTAAQKTVESLRQLGFTINWSDVTRLVQRESPVSKGHIMQALRKAGYIKSHDDARHIMSKYLNWGGMAYVYPEFQFLDAVEFIKASKGIPVLAHPGLIRNDALVEELCETGIEGLEVYYHYFGHHKEQKIRTYSALAESKGLVKTGGSDYHGSYTQVVLGENFVPFLEIAEFLHIFGIN